MCSKARWRSGGDRRIQPRHSVVPWLVEYSSFHLNRFEVGHDGKTACERCREGKPGRRVLSSARKSAAPLGKLASLWESGVFVDVRGKTGELMVSDSQGVYKTRTVQRRPQPERWSQVSTAELAWVRWRPSEDVPECDGEKLETGKLSERVVVKEGTEGEKAVPTRLLIREGRLGKVLDAHLDVWAAKPFCREYPGRGTRRRAGSDSRRTCATWRK